MAILNVKTVFTKIIFKEVENPTIKKKLDSGIILANMHKSEESGEFENANNFMGFGEVIEIGPDIKTIKPGDYIFYMKPSVTPVPRGTETWMIAEQQVVAYVEGEDPSLAEAFEAWNKQEEELKAALPKGKTAKLEDIGLVSADGREPSNVGPTIFV